MFSDGNNFGDRKLAPNSSSNVKVIKIMLYPGVDGTGPLEDDLFKRIEKSRSEILSLFNMDKRTLCSKS